ncbi:hypothetical protein [Amycolatopsis magusensis]|uniref:hypothetical protein n=1 Tax=Amycolatopsis magusensis TaxID=882444 RepID=UPI0037950575
MTSWTHVLAVLVGAARPDGDVYAHFDSLRGFPDHLAVAQRLNLVRDAAEPVADDDPEVVPTDAGRAFIEQFRLTELPEGRANYWHLRHAALLEPAAAELTRRWNALHAERPSRPDRP